MNIFLSLAFLFCVGSFFGWVLELFFRRFISSANPERKWINPGFCTGPYLPLYGNGLCILYLVADLEEHLGFSNPVLGKITVFIIMTLLMTLIEYIAGILSLKMYHIRLWDYSDEWGNIQGIICPKFSLAWGALGAVYYFLVHPHVKDAVRWLGNNLAFSFFIGVFFGVFAVDVVHSLQLVAKLKQFAKENDVELRYERVKERIRKASEQAKEKYHFFKPFGPAAKFSEHMKNILSAIEAEKEKRAKQEK